jgi:hypothetical protein
MSVECDEPGEDWATETIFAVGNIGAAVLIGRGLNQGLSHAGNLLAIQQTPRVAVLTFVAGIAIWILIKLIYEERRMRRRKRLRAKRQGSSDVHPAALHN